MRNPAFTAQAATSVKGLHTGEGTGRDRRGAHTSPLRGAALFATFALVALDALFFRVVGAVLPVFTTPLPGTLLLLAATALATSLPRVEEDSSGSTRRAWVAPLSISAGALMALSSSLVPFPIGCNVNPCPMDPAGAWWTVWPNFTMLVAGTVLFGLGLGKRRSDALSSVGLGVGCTLSGIMLAAYASGVTYFTSCPVNGCPPLTLAEWWSTFWPDVGAEACAVALVVTGSILILRWRRGRRSRADDLSLISLRSHQ